MKMSWYNDTWIMISKLNKNIDENIKNIRSTFCSNRQRQPSSADDIKLLLYEKRKLQ